jgi:carbonic anhydrase
VAGAKAILVLGHTECGAVKGAIDGAKLGLLTKMLENFNPAIEASAGAAGDDKSSKNKALVQAVADKNALLAAKALTERSEVLRELVEQKQLVIAAAMHDVNTGAVRFL